MTDNSMCNARDFGAVGDGKNDDTHALQKTFDHTSDTVVIPPGHYRLTRGLKIHLTNARRFALQAAGVRLINESTEPALHIIGSHLTSASPEELTDDVAVNQLMPCINGVTIDGISGENDGIRLERTFMAVISQVTVTNCRHGIHIVDTNRNIIISDSHIYHNAGVGIFLDDVSLHQINIHGSHISYNLAGGIKIDHGNIRNVQIVGNDIEYNRDTENPTREVADVWLVAGPIGIREGAICGNTIQATPTIGGANVRLEGIGPDNRLKVGLFSITGNLITSQDYNIICRYARGVTLGDNCHICGETQNILLEHCDQCSINGTVIDGNPDYGPHSCGGIRLRNCSAVTINGVVVHDSGPRAAIGIEDSSMVSISSAIIKDPRGAGIALQNCTACVVQGCIIKDIQGAMDDAVTEENCTQVVSSNNIF